MKIDLPITIIFDCQEANQGAYGRSAGSIVCTLRYEIDGDGRDAVLFGSYPPNEAPVLMGGKMHTPEGEPAQAVLSFIDTTTDKRINARAARSPWDYMVGTEAERTIAQEETDEQRAQDGS